MIRSSLFTRKHTHTRISSRRRQIASYYNHGIFVRTNDKSTSSILQNIQVGITTRSNVGAYTSRIGIIDG